MTISGAAASPNMGYHSSPTVTFLMSLLNVRLGWWLTNPGEPGRHCWYRSEPLAPILTLIAELLGKTNDRSRYVYLSDGGHFENLAIYEMVLRRCRFIVVVDGGADPAREFEDLGNAIRKIRVDLGITIGFPNIKFDHPGEGLADEKSTRCAIGTIYYKQRDDPRGENDAVQNGTIVYIKPTIRGDESPDVLNYWKQFPDFPHQSTGDQFFDEPQFESYRKLGRLSLDDVFRDSGNDKLDHYTVSAFIDLARKNAMEYK